MPTTIDGTPVSTSAAKRTTCAELRPRRTRPGRARRRCRRAARSAHRRGRRGSSVPTIAFAMPPPALADGLRQLREEVERERASAAAERRRRGSTSERHDARQRTSHVSATMTLRRAPPSVARLVALRDARCSRRGSVASTRRLRVPRRRARPASARATLTMSVTHEEHERRLRSSAERWRSPVASRELVRDERRHRVARREERRARSRGGCRSPSSPPSSRRARGRGRGSPPMIPERA